MAAEAERGLGVAHVGLKTTLSLAASPNLNTLRALCISEIHKALQNPGQGSQEAQSKCSARKSAFRVGVLD